jgi:hypothetical protein
MRTVAYVVLAVWACLAGCKAGEAKSAGFVDKQQMQRDPAMPFHRVWIMPGFDDAHYTRLYVAPVNTAYMLKVSDWQKGERKDQLVQDVAKLGKYTEAAMIKAFREDPEHRMEVVDSPTTQPATLSLEVALIEVVPSKVLLNALGYAPFFVGLGITAVRTVINDQSTVAFEARFRDAASGTIVMTMADREGQQMAPVTVRGLTWYGFAEGIINDWAAQFVLIMNRKPGEKIKDTDPITLQPW